MEGKLEIKNLALKVLEELVRLNYANNTICQFRAFYKRICTFANEKGEAHFSEELGTEFLKEKYNCIVNYYQEVLPAGTKHR